MLGITDIGLFVTAFLILLILPGPGNLALLTATSKGGIKAGMLTTLGVIAGDQTLMWSATGGVAALLFRYPSLFSLLQWAGAAYLAYLGVLLLIKKTEQQTRFSMRDSGYALQGYLITLLNPKALIFYMAFFPQFIDPVHHQGIKTLLFMAAIVIFITLIYGVIFCILAKRLAQPLRNKPRLVLWLERLAGISLLFFAAELLLR